MESYNQESYLQYDFWNINIFTSELILRKLSTELGTNIHMKNGAFLETFTVEEQLFVSSFLLLQHLGV